VITACVIMHNMITEDERGDNIHDQEGEFHSELVVLNPRPALFQ
jgi:hypothetical protein